jgi:hypothetical protein
MINAINKVLNEIFLSPDEIKDKEMSDKLAELAIMDNLEHLQDALEHTIKQGGTNTVNHTVDALNNLLALKLTGKHKMYLCNTPVELSFNYQGGLVSIKVQGELPKKDSIHLKPALKTMQQFNRRLP